MIDEHPSFTPAFPQPNVHRSSSQVQRMGRPNHHTRSDYAAMRLDPTFLHPNANFSQASFASYNSNEYHEAYSDDTSHPVKGFSDKLLQSEEGLK